MTDFEIFHSKKTSQHESKKKDSYDLFIHKNTNELQLTYIFFSFVFFTHYRWNYLIFNYKVSENTLGRVSACEWVDEAYWYNQSGLTEQKFERENYEK